MKFQNLESLFGAGSGIGEKTAKNQENDQISNPRLRHFNLQFERLINLQMLSDRAKLKAETSRILYLVSDVNLIKYMQRSDASKSKKRNVLF